MIGRVWGACLLVIVAGMGASADAATCRGIWACPEDLAALPMTGPAWERMKAEADKPVTPNLADQNDAANVRVLAKALVYARTGQAPYREAVMAACMAAIGSERGGTTLALGRELAAYVIAADIVGLPRAEDDRFRAWLRAIPQAELHGQTLRSTHERRPNNWGTHAGASRLAVALYLGDRDEVARVAGVFRGWLGDGAAYDGFRFGDAAWQADPGRPVGINPRGAKRDGHSIDGVLPDDQRRCCKGFTWPPPRENYVYEALQGALAQAVMLHRVGYDVWNWQDRALLRAFRWLHEQASYPAEGDDSWQPWLINHYYGTAFPALLPSRPGKNVGFTDWTHGKR